MSLFWKKLFKQLRIRDKGKNNVIKLPKGYYCKNALISIEGDNNVIEIDEHFICRGKFSLRIQGNNNKIHLGKNFYCHTYCSLTLYAQNSTLNFGDDVHIYISLDFESFGGKNNLLVDIGNRVTFMNTAITCFEEDSSIIVGDDCIFSYDTVLYNTDGHPIYAIDGDEPLNRAHQIKLGKRIWVAHSVVILKNVELGNNLILGRGALVNKSCLQDNCVLAGMPARIVKENVRWELPFPAVGEKSKFKGRAAPDIVMPKPTKP